VLAHTTWNTNGRATHKAANTRLLASSSVQHKSSVSSLPIHPADIMSDKHSNVSKKKRMIPLAQWENEQRPAAKIANAEPSNGPVSVLTASSSSNDSAALASDVLVVRAESAISCAPSVLPQTWSAPDLTELAALPASAHPILAKLYGFYATNFISHHHAEHNLAACPNGADVIAPSHLDHQPIIDLTKEIKTLSMQYPATTLDDISLVYEPFTQACRNAALSLTAILSVLNENESKHCGVWVDGVFENSYHGYEEDGWIAMSCRDKSRVINHRNMPPADYDLPSKLFVSPISIVLEMICLSLVKRGIFMYRLDDHASVYDLEGVQHLTALLRQLLSLSRLDAGLHRQFELRARFLYRIIQLPIFDNGAQDWRRYLLNVIVMLADFGAATRISFDEMKRDKCFFTRHAGDVALEMIDRYNEMDDWPVVSDCRWSVVEHLLRAPSFSDVESSVFKNSTINNQLDDTTSKYIDTLIHVAKICFDFEEWITCLQSSYVRPVDIKAIIERMWPNTECGMSTWSYPYQRFQTKEFPHLSTLINVQIWLRAMVEKTPLRVANYHLDDGNNVSFYSVVLQNYLLMARCDNHLPCQPFDMRMDKLGTPFKILDEMRMLHKAFQDDGLLDIVDFFKRLRSIGCPLYARDKIYHSSVFVHIWNCVHTPKGQNYLSWRSVHAMEALMTYLFTTSKMQVSTYDWTTIRSFCVGGGVPCDAKRHALLKEPSSELWQNWLVKHQYSAMDRSKMILFDWCVLAEQILAKSNTRKR